MAPVDRPGRHGPFVRYWCALSGVCEYDYVDATSVKAAAVEYVRSTLREGWEARPYARHLDGTFTVRVLGEGPAGIGAETPADVRVEWTVHVQAGAVGPCVVFAQAVGP